MKIVYAGSPEYAVPALERLIVAGKNVAAVVTQPDRPVGRKGTLTPTPVKKCAEAHGLPVYDFDKIREHTDVLASLGADVMITCAYGQILSDGVLACFAKGVWNLHASLLPKFRGASPIQSAILAGETHTGVTVMKTELSLDTGDVLLVKRCEIGTKTCGELSAVLSGLSADAALETVELLEAGEPQLLLQDESAATYCKKITKADAKINFGLPAEQVARLIRAMSPAPAAYCMLRGGVVNIYGAEAVACGGDGKAGEVLSADRERGVCVKCGDGAVKILSAQLAGGKILSATDLVNGRKLKAGDVLD